MCVWRGRGRGGHLRDQAEVRYRHLVADAILARGLEEQLLERHKAVVDGPLAPLHLVLNPVLAEHPEVLECGGEGWAWAWAWAWQPVESQFGGPPTRGRLTSVTEDVIRGQDTYLNRLGAGGDDLAHLPHLE